MSESYEERLRERFEAIRDMALDALDMLDAQKADDDHAPIGRPGEPSWMLGQIAAEVAAAQTVAAEHRPDEDA